jgi:hypothetical protein
MGKRGRHHTNPRGRRNGDRRHATPSVNTIVANKNGCINDGDESHILNMWLLRELHGNAAVKP